MFDDNDFESDSPIKDMISKRLEIFEDKYGEEKLSSSISTLLMRSIDLLWVEHLTTMDNMRQGIGLQAAGQRDPLVQYKKTGFELFENLLSRINRDVSLNLLPFTSSFKFPFKSPFQFPFNFLLFPLLNFGVPSLLKSLRVSFLILS